MHARKLLRERSHHRTSHTALYGRNLSRVFLNRGCADLVNLRRTTYNSDRADDSFASQSTVRRQLDGQQHGIFDMLCYVNEMIPFTRSGFVE